MSPNQTGASIQCSSSASKLDSARVRDNQRRSRARRKEYLQELESKLRKCEASGVQASVDIQLAARSVSEENARLREENGKLREDNERLRQMLRKSEEGVKALLDDRTNGSSIRDGETRTSHPQTATEMNKVPAIQDTATSPKEMNTHHYTNVFGSAPFMHIPTQKKYSSQPPDASPGYALSTEMHQIVASNASTHIKSTPSETPDQDSCHTSNDDLPFGDDTSSCEYAAHIITSMRADVSTDEVRADLGCGSDVKEWRRCKVDNSKLFVAVDRYAG